MTVVLLIKQRKVQLQKITLNRKIFLKASFGRLFYYGKEGHELIPRAETYSKQAVVFYFALLLYWLGTTSWNVYGWHDQQRVAQLGLLCILLMIRVAYSSRYLYLKTNDDLVSTTFPFYLSPSALMFVSFALCGFVSAMLASFSHWALLEWALLLSVCFGVLGVAQLRQIEGIQFDRAVLLIIISVCTFYLLSFLGRYGTLFGGIPLRVWDIFTGFDNLRFFGQFQTMTLPLLAVFVVCAQSRLCRWSIFALLSSWWMLSIVSGTRGTWLAMFVAMVGLWFVGRRSCRIWVLWQMAGIAVGLLFYILLFLAVPYMLSNAPELINRLPTLSSLSLRDVLWAESWRMICSHPLLGVGPMHFAAVPNSIGAHPHNAILQIAAEWGIPALLMLLGVIALGFHRFLKILLANEDEISFGNMLRLSLFASLVAAATQSLVDGVIVMPYSQVTLMLIVGWSMGIANGERTLPEKAMSALSVTVARREAAALIGVMALLLGTVMALALPDVPHLQNRMRHYLDVQHTMYFMPRFWLQGWINE